MHHHELFVVVAPSSLINWLTAAPFPVQLCDLNVGNGDQKSCHGYEHLVHYACIVGVELSEDQVTMPLVVSKSCFEVFIAFPDERRQRFHTLESRPKAPFQFD